MNDNLYSVDDLKVEDYLDRLYSMCLVRWDKSHLPIEQIVLQVVEKLKEGDENAVYSTGGSA